VADYPFTTLEPVLGTIDDDEGRQLVLADIPGLIEGASAGAGLGQEFLAHVERTQLLLALVDVAPADGVSPERTFESVRKELAQYGAGLETRPFIVVLSKVDLLDPETVAATVERWDELLEGDEYVCRERGRPLVLATSSVTGAGLERLAHAVFTHAAVALEPDAGALPAETGEEIAEYAVYRPAERSDYTVERCGEHAFVISGPAVERLVERHDLENWEALAYIEERLKAMGVIRELEAQGFEPGEEVLVGDVAFVLYPEVVNPD